MQNGYIESFNGKFRDECLNEQWFETLQQARSAIGIWRQDYNELDLQSQRKSINLKPRTSSEGLVRREGAGQ